MGYPRSIGAVTGQLGRFTQRRPKLGAALIILPIFGVLVACAPADQEECRAEAAAKAPTKAGLEELLYLCEQQFPATRKLGGGYEYNGVPVAGPVPTAAEIRAIQEAQEAELGCMTEIECAMTEAEAFTDANALNGSAGTEAADSRTMDRQTPAPPPSPGFEPGGVFYEHNKRILQRQIDQRSRP